MRAPVLPFVLILIPGLVTASEPVTGTPMTGAEFEAYTQGMTLTFSAQGQVYGAEQYLSGRRVMWAFTEDICREGHWYEENGQICFSYDYDPAPQCWVFWEDDGLNALFMGAPNGTRLKEEAKSSAPLPCAGPEVGV